MTYRYFPICKVSSHRFVTKTDSRRLTDRRSTAPGCRSVAGRRRVVRDDESGGSSRSCAARRSSASSESCCRLISNVQGLNNSASLAPAIAARAFATFSSNVASSSFVEFATSPAVMVHLPARDQVNPDRWCSWPSVGMLPECVASPPIAIDFACGFQSDLSSGTRSSVLRVFAIS